MNHFGLIFIITHWICFVKYEKEKIRKKQEKNMLRDGNVPELLVDSIRFPNHIFLLVLRIKSVT